jgi:hypothetical protein
LTIAVLLILAVLWAAVLVPPALRSRSENRRGDAISPLNFRFGRSAGLGPMFNRSAVPGRGLGIYRPAAFATRSARGPIPARVPGELTPAQRRRRDVLLVLLGAAALTLVLAAFTGVITFWVVHLLTDVLLATYVFLLVQLKQRAAPRPAPPAPPTGEHRRQLRHVPHVPTVAQTSFAIRRVPAP